MAPSPAAVTVFLHQVPPASEPEAPLSKLPTRISPPTDSGLISVW